VIAAVANRVDVYLAKKGAQAKKNEPTTSAHSTLLKLWYSFAGQQFVKVLADSFHDTTAKTKSAKATMKNAKPALSSESRDGPPIPDTVPGLLRTVRH